MEKSDNNIIQSYRHDRCPDCGLRIPENTDEGNECEECGHVFWEELDNAD
jgi:DNA-directed RNA polymerase subunit RPC12/RpoP